MKDKQLWQWRGISSQGAPIQGNLWANDRASAWLMAQQEGVFTLSLKRRPVKKSHWRSTFSSDIVQQLATLLQAGLTLSDSLMLLAEQHPIPQWQALLQTLARQLAQGHSFSVAIRQWPDAFPPLYYAMIRAGEMTGKLDLCCVHLARQQKAQNILNQKVKKALRYPLIILLLALLVVMGMSGFVLPEFAGIYKTFNAPLPALTRVVMALSGGVQQAFPAIIALALLFVLCRPLLQRNPRWQMLRPQLQLSLPVFSGLIRGQMLCQIFTVLSLTQNAGIPFLQGLESVEETLSCPWWRRVIRQISESVAHGNAIWQTLESSEVFTPLCKQLIRTGEISGSLDKMLENLAGYHRDQTHQQAENLATLLEPVLLVVTGVIIGTLVVAMYLPIFQLGDAISSAG